jgi:hypothetical protein
MTGVEIAQPGGGRSIVLFNSQGGQVPPPVTSTSYDFRESGPVSHTLTGLVPGGHYSVEFRDGVVRVEQNASAANTASSAGVLHFTLSSSSPPSRRRGVRR